jgi:BCD family chlorophyll transporter-like MFS transporter
MEISKVPDSQHFAPDGERLTPRLRLFTMFRLGLFQMGLGMLSLLTLGVLNRIMIDELKIPGLIAAGTISMYQFVAPARVWFGQLSDARPIRGYHRTGYIWFGLLAQIICLFLAVQVVWLLHGSLTQGWTGQTIAIVGLQALMFALYGLCVSSSSTPFAALLVDVSDEDNRSKLVGVVWSMLMVGIVAGAITSQKLLHGLTPETLQPTINRLFVIIPAIVLCLGLLATFGIEKKYSRYGVRSRLGDREDSITLATAWKVLTASRQTGIFFCFLLVMTIGLFLQQPILEPYAGEVFGMTVGQGAGLNAFWGIGVLVGMSVSGFAIVPRLGKQLTARWGCWLTAACFILIILAGVTANQLVLRLAVLLFGLCSGVLTNSAISLMLDLTAAETAGTFIGAWGLAQAIAQALGNVGGGAILDLGRHLFRAPLPAYSLVFACEAVAMLVAVWLLRWVNVKEFTDRTRVAIAAVVENELE